MISTDHLPSFIYCLYLFLHCCIDSTILSLPRASTYSCHLTHLLQNESLRYWSCFWSSYWSLSFCSILHILEECTFVFIFLTTWLSHTGINLASYSAMNLASCTEARCQIKMLLQNALPPLVLLQSKHGHWLFNAEFCALHFFVWNCLQNIKKKIKLQAKNRKMAP